MRLRTFSSFFRFTWFGPALLASAFGQGLTDGRPTTPDFDEIAALWEALDSETQQEWRLRVGFNYSRGEYGSDSTTTLSSVVAAVNYSPAPEWEFQMSVPYVRIESESQGVITSGIFRRRVTTTTLKTSESGLGDVIVGATRSWAEAWGPVSIDLSGRVSLPTADEAKGLGSGQSDYYVQTDIVWQGGAITWFVSPGYRILGDPDGQKWDDGFFGSIGAITDVGEAGRLGVSLDWEQASTAQSDDALEATVFGSHRFDAAWTGLTDASADIGFGASAGWRF
jgi:hypothetical protein